MATSHCRRLHGFILLLVMFLSSVFSLASNMDVEYKMCLAYEEPKDGTLMPLDFECEKGYVISNINFADYGQATGTCGNFKPGNCGAIKTLIIVKTRCVTKERCKLFIPDKVYGPSNCKGDVRLAVDATCKKT